MTRTSRRRRRPQGGIEELPSGSLRVYAYSNIDPGDAKRALRSASLGALNVLYFAIDNWNSRAVSIMLETPLRVGNFYSASQGIVNV
jgi:hypothetical protein